MSISTKLSFKIKEASSSLAESPRWDQQDSSKLIKLAREVYFLYLANTSNAEEPKGVVINQNKLDGKVVFIAPTALLPEEQYLKIEDFLFRKRKLKHKTRAKA